MKRMTLLAVVLAVMLAPAAASAHPLGNFTTNHYSRIVASGDRIYVLYVLDLAEIPTFQGKQAGGIDGAAYARRIASHVSLTVDGTARLSNNGAIVTVSGTIACNRSAEFAEVDAFLTQTVGRFKVVGFGFSETSCGPSPTAWSLDVSGDTGRFEIGRASCRERV